MNVHLDRHSCKVCNKNYSSSSSLWNNNNKFHKHNVVVCGTTVVLCMKLMKIIY